MSESATPPHPNPVCEPTLIEQQNQLEDLCAQCRVEGRFAFDTEFVMEDRYEPEVCLIQIATSDKVVLLDPYKGLDLSPVWNLVCDEEVETVVHAGQEDLSLCVQHTDRLPRNIFDVQIAAGLAKGDYPLSLQKLVQSIMHIRLHKSKTLTNWRKRPLTREQIRYAAEDVLYLLPLRDDLVNRLRRLKRMEWAVEEFRFFEDGSLYRRAEEDKLRLIKGSGSLKGWQLAVLRALLPWRDQIALKRNRPPRSVIKDHLLVEIAKLGLTSFSEIRDLRGINLSDRDVRAMGRVVRDAKNLPEEEWPLQEARDTPTPGEEVLTALATAVLRSYGSQHGIAYGLVASKKSIGELIHFLNRDGNRPKSEVELLSGWREKAVGRMLTRVLSGKSAVRVTHNNGKPQIDVLSGDS